MSKLNQFMKYIFIMQYFEFFWIYLISWFIKYVKAIILPATINRITGQNFL